VPALAAIPALFVLVEASFVLAQLALCRKPTPPSSAPFHDGHFPQDT